MRSSTFRRSSYAVVAAAALALAGCSGQTEPTDAGSSASVDTGQSDEGSSSTDGDSSSATDSSDASTDGASGQESTPPDADLSDVEFSVTAQDALDTSADEVGSDGIVHAIELDYSDSDAMWEWSVKTLVEGTDHKVKIDADTGDVVAHEQDSTDDQEKAIDLDDPMTKDEAQELALNEVDGPIEGWKLEWDDGMFQYEFDIGDGQGDETEVTVDAETGDVTQD